MSETDTLCIEAIDKDCWRVTHEDSDTESIVMEIQIAGVEISREYGSFKFEIECTEWGIEGDYHPSLLVEPAEWFNLKGDTDE